MDKLNKSTLEKFGFKFGSNSTHIRRTMMLSELEMLLASLPNAYDKEEYIFAIVNSNCLGKRTQKTKEYTAQYLADLYAINPQIPLFRALLYFWNREPEARPLIALLCSSTRDPLLRKSLRVILDTPENAVLTREKMEEFVDTIDPERFSKITLASIAKNLNSSWTQSGHLKGKAKKVRIRAKATPAATAYALYLGYLQGIRGPELFETDFVKMMDCSREKAIEHAEIASQRGWIVFKRIGNIMEILFPNLITAEEVEWLREQN